MPQAGKKLARASPPRDPRPQVLRHRGRHDIAGGLERERLGEAPAEGPQGGGELQARAAMTNALALGPAHRRPTDRRRRRTGSRSVGRSPT